MASPVGTAETTLAPRRKGVIMEVPDAGLGLLHRRTEAACVILNFLIATSDGRKTGSQYQSNAKSNI